MFHTTIAGSLPKPFWLAETNKLWPQWKSQGEELARAKRDATLLWLKEQEAAGVDIVTDGELQRDNMIDYFAERIPGVQADQGSKRLYYDFYESVVRSTLATGSLGLADEVRFLRRFTTHPSKISISGPHALVKRIRNDFYPSEEAFALDLARVMNFELRELVREGATHLQIDEPYYSGFPEDLPWAIRAVNALVDGVSANITLHVCYGNRYGKPSFEGTYRYLFPHVLEARVQAISLEFARRGEEDLQLFKEFKVPFALGMGVIDVKTHDIESPGLIADRIRRALDVIPVERLVINPDCGLVHLPRDVAFNKLSAMAEGARMVREGLTR